MYKVTRVILASAVVAGLSVSGAVLADQDEIRLLKETKIDLVKAIRIAEEAKDARALEAGIDDDTFSPRYEVTVVNSADEVFELEIDGVTGEVLRIENDTQ